jgi:hypothetical protein
LDFHRAKEVFWTPRGKKGLAQMSYHRQLVD